MLIHDFPHILHGGDWNPDQYSDSPEIIDADFRLMDKARCDIFSVGIFSWGQLEIEENKFDFSWLDDIFAKAEKHGKKLFLATPSAARPGWMGRKYPETALVNRDGVRQPWKGRQTACLNSELFRRKVVAIDRMLAERYAGHPALAGWHISNEYSTECFCPCCLARFHDFLHERYGTLDELNRHYWSAFWGHRLSGWDQIDPRDAAINIAALDWKRWLSNLHLEFFRMEIAAVREFSQLPLTTNMMGLYGHLDYWKFAGDCDFIADDCYPFWSTGGAAETAARFAAFHDMHYAMKNQPFLMMESCPGIANYQDVVRIRRPREFQREMLLALGHGADGTMYFQWRKGRGNCEQLHGAVVGHDGGGDTMVFRDVADYGAKLDRLAGIIGSVRHPEVALVFDWESRWCLGLAAGFGGDAAKKTDETIFAHYRALWEQNYELAVIDSDQPFDAYKVVVAPMLYLIKDGVAEKMRRFVEAGGTLIVTYLSAYVDQSNRCFGGGNPGGPALRKLFGVWSEDIDGLPSEVRQSIIRNGVEYPVTDYAEILNMEGAEAAAGYGREFYAGTPAVTVNRFGKGRAVYIGARTGLDFLTDFYREELTGRNIFPVLSGMPSGVVVSRRTGTGGVYYFLLNLTEHPVVVETPEPLVDIWNGEKAAKSKLELPPNGSTVLMGKI